MSGTQSKDSEKKDNKLLMRKRPNLVIVEKSIREEGPKLSEKQKKEYNKLFGRRTEPRESAKWDSHPLGPDNIPASDMRYRVFEEMRSRGYKGRNAVAKMFGVSRAFVTKWTKILRAVYEIGAGVRNACIALSTRPRETRSPAAERAEGTVLSAKKTYSFLGPKKIEVMFAPGASASTIGRIIRKHGLQREHKPYKKHKYVRYERPFSMYMLQTDYKEWGDGVYSIWALDDRSRMILGHRVVPNATTEVAKELLEEVFAKYGRPIQLLTDHGSQFTTMHKDGEHDFESWLSEKKVKHIMGRVNHPQTQGKIERSHGSAKTEMGPVWGGTPETIEEYRDAVRVWVDFYNMVRVHESLDYKTPYEVFFENRPDIGDPVWMEAVRKEFPDGGRVC